MIRIFALIITAAAIASAPAMAQIYPTQYRPPSQQWQKLRTTHFKLVFSNGNDSTAFRLGRILEHQYLPTKQLAGGKLRGCPGILHGSNYTSTVLGTSFS